MDSDKQYIAKGNYRYSQIGHFVKVTNYIFLRNGKKKCLLLRFFNEMDEAVDGISYTVFQYDSQRNLIAHSQVSHRDISVNPHHSYTPSVSLVVQEKCVDFKVVFSQVSSGNYRYKVIDGVVSVYYDGISALPYEPKRNESDCDHFVRRRIFAEEGGARFFAAMIVLILIALNIMNMVFAYSEKEKSEQASDAWETRETLETQDAADETQDVNLNDGEQYVEV